MHTKRCIYYETQQFLFRFNRLPYGLSKADYSDRSFVTRMDNPDVLLVFGGTNDSWAKVPIGDYQYADWSKEDLYNFRPAFCRLMDYLIKNYPDTKIYNITNSELSEGVTNSIDEICRHYGVPNIRLHDIEKQTGHPFIKGMKSINEQIWEVVGKEAVSQSGKAIFLFSL